MNVRTGTGLFKNFIRVCFPIIALAVACSGKAAAHFNPGDRVEAAVTISCPDSGICSCVIPQGTQGTVLCYDAEDPEYPYFVHWDNGCNPYHDVDEGEFVDYCAESDDWGVWMASDEIAGVSSTPTPAIPISSDPLDNWHVRSAPVSNQLEAVTYAENIFVAVGYNGTILTSSDGTEWTDRSISGVSKLKSVAYGNNMFIAVGQDGSIHTSPEGVVWTRRTSGTLMNLNDVMCVGNTFVVVGNFGTILTSQDGVTWTSRVSGTSKNLFKVAYGRGVFVAVGGQYSIIETRLILTSSDVITWTQRFSENGKIFTGVAYGNSTFVAVDARDTVFTSADGIIWTKRTSISCSPPIKEIVYIQSTFIVTCSNGEIFTSPDGITWTSRDSGVSKGSLRGITYGNNSVVIVGLEYTNIMLDTGTNIILQSDPFTFTAIPIPAACQDFPCSPATLPVLSTDPSQAKPMGLGPVAEGGGTLNITIHINQFSGPVDIYFGLYSPEIDPDNIYLLTSGGAFQKLSESLAPWKANITGPIDESLFGDIQTSSLPKGTYYLYLLVTPTGKLSNYYLWITNFSMEQLSGSAGNWTGRYGSGRFGLSFVVDNNKNIDDFTFTINLNGTCGSDIPFENENSDFLGSDVITVEPDGTFEFMAGGSDEVNDIITNIVVTGVFTDDSHASGTFKTSDIFFIKRDSSCAGSFLYDISWEAAKDCSFLPDEGVSATRFCH